MKYLSIYVNSCNIRFMPQIRAGVTLIKPFTSNLKKHDFKEKIHTVRKLKAADQSNQS